MSLRDKMLQKEKEMVKPKGTWLFKHLGQLATGLKNPPMAPNREKLLEYRKKRMEMEND